jgi:hypothetical protein
VGARHTCAAALALHNARRRGSRTTPLARPEGATRRNAAATPPPGARAAAPLSHTGTATTNSADGSPGGSRDGSGGGSGTGGAEDVFPLYDIVDNELLALAAGGVTGVCEWLEMHAPEALTCSAAAAAADAAAAQAAAEQATAAHAAAQATAAAAEAAASPLVLHMRPAVGAGAGAAPWDVAAAVAAAAAAASLHGCTVHVKLPAAQTPLALPTDALHAVLGMGGGVWAPMTAFDSGDALQQQQALAMALFPFAMATPVGAVRPGCVLLSLDALTEAGAPRRDAAGAAGALRAACAASGVGIGADADAAPELRGALLLVDGAAAPLDAAAAAAVTQPAVQPAAPRVRPCAALLPAAADDDDDDVAGAATTTTTTLRFELSSYDAGSSSSTTTLHARLGGRTLRCAAAAGVGGAAAALTLTLTSREAEEGAALIEAQRIGVTRAGRATLAISPPAALLLCRDAAVVAQACVTGDALAAAPTPSEASSAALAQLLRIAGAALAPDAPRRVRVAAAAACVWLGWDALLTRLLRDGDGALILCAAAHATAAASASTPACVAAVAAAAAAAWPRAACAAACDALREAAAAPDGGGDGVHPACAAEAALARLQQRRSGAAEDVAAAALLSAVLDLLETAPLLAAADAAPSAATAAAATAAAAAAAAALSGGGVADSAALRPAVLSAAADAEAAEAAEAAYVAHLARVNTTTWLAVSLLSFMNTCSHLFSSLRYVLLAPHAGGLMTANMGATNGALISRTRLLPLSGGAAFPATDVPFDVVVAHVRMYAAGLLLLLLPHSALVYHSVRMARTRRAHRRYKRIFFSLMLCDTSFYMFVDLLVVHATGAVVEWPAWPAATHAAGLFVTHLRGPFCPRLNIVSVIFRLLIFCWTLAYVGGLGAVVRDPGCLAMLAAVALTAWRTQRRDVAMRAEHAALLRAEAAARAMAARLKAD